MGLKAAVQALKKAEELKARVSRHSDLLNNSEAWSDQQQLQTVYHQVLVLDLEYALDKKVEQELWTLGFKNHIAALQHLSRDKKNPRRSECQALLSWCLEAASGFYLTLLQELCSTFELDLPFRRRSAIYGQTKPWPNSEQLMQPHKTSCLYICQYCLVHLGDIARYRSQRKQAESFYRYAILLSPSSGQPYNQLALLEASRGDKLATVFHYVRSISVKYPFPAAATNLANTFSALIDNEEPLVDMHSKLSQNEFILMFLRVHSLLHSVTDLNQAESYVKTLNATYTALVATQVFSSVKLIQMTAINLYALRHTVDSLSTNQLTQDEKVAKHLVLELLAGALSAYLLPIYTMKDNSVLLDYYALPAIKLTLDWIKTEPYVLNDIVFTKRLQLWPSLCKLLNNLQNNIGDFSVNKYEKVPLPEDRDLQCFLPLMNAFKDLDFSSDNLHQDASIYNNLRTMRLVSLGSWLCSQQANNTVVMTCRTLPNTTGLFFEPENKQPDPTTELLEELKFFNIQENNYMNGKDILQNYKSTLKVTEKRGGILKPQGSLEKSREEREQALLLSENDNSSCTTTLSNSSLCSVRSDVSKSKRPRQNVALQALAKKVEENNKQVTFQTEPIIKTIDKPHISKLQPELSKEALRMKELPHPPAMNPSYPAGSELLPGHCLPGAGAAPKLSYPFNQGQAQGQAAAQAQGYPRLNVGNIPFPMQYQSQQPSSVLYHNSVPQPSGMQFARQQLINMPPSNVPAKPASAGFLGFDRSVPPAQLAPKDPFSPWLVDEKLPMPPSTWWSNNQKPLPVHAYPSQTDAYPYNIGTSSLDYGLQYNANTSAYSNMSVWNPGPSLQSNIHMLLNPPAPSAQAHDGNKIRDAMPQSTIESSDNQTNSMPGYSLFNSNWAPNLVRTALQSSAPDRPLMRQQSLFSGPGPSPLERLLEQQKQMRGPREDT